MDFTSTGIPLTLRFAFQEYDLERLDLEANAFIIIERTLAYGGLKSAGSLPPTAGKG